jgi:hypothetical protein
MKLNFSKSIGRPWAKSLPFLACLLLSPLAVMATASGYTNTTTIIYAPGYSGNTVPSIQVDATNFVNFGTWEIYTYDKYHTANTLNYINESSMWGEVGWDFALYPSTTGQRGMSANFLNDYGATIQAVDLSVANPETLGDADSTFDYPVSWLWISATNIVNNGTLIGDGGGEIRLTGVNVDLFLGTLEIGSFARGGSGNSTNSFTSAAAIYDEYWQQTSFFPSPPYPANTPYTLNSSTIWDGNVSISPIFYVNEPCAVLNATAQIGFGPSLADSISITNLLTEMTNIIVYTNFDGSTGITNVPVQIFRQAVFVAISDANITPADRFSATGNPTNLFRTATVRLTSAFGDALYLVDALASADPAFSTNRGVLLNRSTVPGSNPLTPCTDPTYRPANYNLSGLDPGQFGAGMPGQGVPTNNFLYNADDPSTDTDFTNTFQNQATYAGYSAYVDELIRRPYGAAVTNLPGTIIIDATNLDLSWTIITNKGAEITVHTGNLIDSTGAVVSCQNLSYNLGSAVGSLNVTNLASISSIPSLFHGTVDAFSALWTNGYSIVISNYSPVVTNITVDTNTITQTNMVLTPITNNVEVDLHVLLLDASGLSTTEPVTVQDLILQTNAVNMLISDSMDVVSTLFLGGQNLTLQGTLDLSGNLQNWTYVNAPNLRYFTNNGALSIPQGAHFGDDGPKNYAAFVNNGTISATSETINSDYFQSGGTISATGGFSVTTSTGKVENASITSGQNVNFSAGNLKLVDNCTITAGRQLNFNVTNSLFDSLYDLGYGIGSSSGNTLTCDHGFNLPLKPATGDLLGTTIRSITSGRVQIDHLWAATNLGPTVAGFLNNVAIGKLVLTHSGTSAPPPPFRFSGAGVNNALYVDYLDLSQLGASYSNMLQFDPNIVIYYAAATNNYTPPQVGGVDQEWEEYLNGQFGGHLRWVTNFAGPNSSVDVLINGSKTYRVNRALRYSKIIDSDGDGLKNYYDSDPFGNGPPPDSIPELALTVSLVQQKGQSSSPMALVQTSQLSSTVLAISWLAAANTIYQVEFATNLPPVNWQPLLAYTNSAFTNQTVTVLDTNAPAGAPQRFYRVSHP